MINVSNNDEIALAEEYIIDAITYVTTLDWSTRNALPQTKNQSLLFKVGRAAEIIARATDSGTLRLSPLRFATTGNFLPTLAIQRMFDISERYASFRSNLQQLGAYARVTKGVGPNTVLSYTSRMDRIVASFVAAGDARSFTTLNPEDFLSWLNFYYDFESRSFSNKALWETSVNISRKCLRTLAGIVGDHLQSPDIRQLALIRRTDETGYKHDLILEKPSVSRVAWIELWTAWRDTVAPTTRGGALGLRYLEGYLSAVETEGAPVSLPEQFLLSERPLSLSIFMERCAEQGRSLNGIINAAGILAKFSDFLVEHLRLNSRSVSYQPLFTQRELRQIKGLADISAKPAPLGKVSARPMPPRLGNVYKQMLLEGPNGWPATHPLCQHPDGSYNPTMPTLFLVTDEIASRVGQIARLDSGEGDLETFDGYSMSWVTNTGPNAGYWSIENPRKPNRGYARKTEDNQVVGIYQNTNKTGRPFLVPWQNADAHAALYGLMLYQREHTPINAPIPPSSYLSDLRQADKKKILSYPTIFPLFRMPPTGRHQVCTPVTFAMRNRFWLDSNEALQTFWNAKHDVDEQIDILTYNKYGQVERSDYNAHGLRSAGITRLIEGGADISLVSELVAGHANLWMTWKYNKQGSLSISERLDAARKVGQDPATQQALIDLKAGGAHAASKILVPSSHATFFHAQPANGGDFLQWANRDHGICATDGQGCENGGPLLRSGKRKNSTDQSTYGSVPGGPGNCFKCRHHMTGPKWKDGVEAYGNLLLERIAQKSRRINEMQERLDVVNAELNQLKPDAAGRLQLRKEVSRLEAAISDLVNQQSILAETVVSVKQKMEEISVAESEQIAKDLRPDDALVISTHSSVVEYSHTSRFEHLAMLRCYGQIYVSLYDHEVDENVKKVIDEITFRSGYEPISMRRCSPQQRKELYDRAMDLVLKCAERFNLNRLDNEVVTLDDLGIPSPAFTALFASRLAPSPISLTQSES